MHTPINPTPTSDTAVPRQIIPWSRIFVENYQKIDFGKVIDIAVLGKLETFIHHQHFHTFFNLTHDLAQPDLIIWHYDNFENVLNFSLDLEFIKLKNSTCF